MAIDKNKIWLGDDFTNYTFDDLVDIVYSNGLQKKQASASLVRFRTYGNSNYYGTFDDFTNGDIGLSMALLEVSEYCNEIRYQRIKRMRKKLTEMIDNDSVCFLTFTFDEHYNDCLDDKTKRRYVKAFFNDHFQSPYIANVDYGEKYGRLHYHAVLTANRDEVIEVLKAYQRTNGEEIKFTWWKYGICWVQQVGTTNTDIARISKYVNKLTNHSFKGTTQYNKAIYFRNYNRYVMDNMWYIDVKDSAEGQIIDMFNNCHNRIIKNKRDEIPFDSNNSYTLAQWLFEYDEYMRNKKNNA